MRSCIVVNRSGNEGSKYTQSAARTMSGWAGMTGDDGDATGEEEQPQERTEGCTGERRVGLRVTFFWIRGSMGARSVR